MLDNKQISKILDYSRKNTSTKSAPAKTSNTSVGSTASTTKKKEEVAPQTTGQTVSVTPVQEIPTLDMPLMNLDVTGGNLGWLKQDRIANSMDLWGLAKKAKNTPKELPSFNSDDELESYYESLPNYNAFERTFNKDKRETYNQKQALKADYDQAVARQGKSQAEKYGLTYEDFITEPNVDLKNKSAKENLISLQTFLGNQIFGKDGTEILNKLKANGVTDPEEQKRIMRDALTYYDMVRKGKFNENWTEYADENKALGTGASSFLNWASTPLATTENAYNYLTGRPYSNSGYNSYLKTSQEMKQKASEDLTGVGSVAYDVASTTLDNLPMYAIGGVFGEAPALTYAGVNAATNSVPELIDRGLTADQITQTAIANGAVEAAVEKLPLGVFEKWGEQPLKKNAKTIAQIIGSQFASEGTEEGVTTLINNLTDVLINADQSKFYQDAQNVGYRQALINVLKEAGHDAIIGALSGGLIGAGNVARQAANGNFVNPLDDALGQVLGEDAETNLENAVLDSLAEEEFTNEDVNAVPTEEEITNEIVNNIVPEEQNAVNTANPEPEIFTNENVNDVPQLNPNEDLSTGMNPDALAILEHYAPESLPNIPQIRADAPAPNADGMTTAQTSRNTFANSPTFNRTQESLKFLEDMQSDGKHKVDIVSEQKSLENARNKLENDYEGTVQDLITKESFGGDDTDASMMVLDDYVKDAIETGDYSKVDSWTRNIINKIHKAAQGLQALAKYSRTASSAIVKTSKMIETIVDNADSKTKRTAEKTAENISNGRLGNTAQNLATDIVDNLNDAPRRETRNNQNQNNNNRTRNATANTEEEQKSNFRTDNALERVRPYDPNKRVKRSKVSNKTHEQIVAEIQQSIENELPNNRMLEDFNADDIEYLANRIENGATTKDLAQALMLRMTYGDFNYVEPEIPTSTNGIVDSALRRMGYDESYTQEEQEQIHHEIVDDIRRSIEKESESVYKDFTDEDFEYLARLVEHGETAKTIADKITQRLETGEWGFSTEDLKRITEIYDQIDKLPPNSQEAYDLENEAFEIMSKYLGEGTFMEKWNQWRYLAMLGNPRTHLRNMIGNTLFGAVTNIKDAIGAGLETISGTDDRTKAIVSRTLDKELFDAAHDDFYKNVYALAKDDGNKYSMQRGVEAHKKIFKSGLINKIANLNNKWLDNEDTFAIERKYERALAGYLKANKLSTDILQGDSEQAMKARAYALNEAKIATFHEDSRLADLLNQISHSATAKGGIGGWAVNTMLESVAPFKKTPINIMKQGVVEYNPLQIAHAIGQSLSNAYNKSKGNTTKFNPSEIINNYAKGMTGSMLFGLGMLLAKMGILRGKGDDDDKFFDEQSYSINIGNHSYTVDWSAPASLPMFVGVEMYNWLSGKSAKEGKTFWDALGSMADPMIEMSMMSGIRDAFKSMSYASDSNAALGAFGANLGVNYLSQAVPTLSGQIARAVDPTRRETYTGKDSGTVSDTVLRNIKKNANKIPGLSNLNQPYLDVWGKEQENVGYDDIVANAMGLDKENIPGWLDLVGRLAYNMTSPGYYSNTERSDVEAEIERLQNSEDRNDDINNLIPSKPDKSYDGEKLTPQEWTQISKEQGRLFDEGYNAIINNGQYQALNDTDKAYTMNEVRKFMGALARYNTFGYDITASDYKNDFDAYRRNGVDGLINNIVGKRQLKEAGIKTSSKLGKEALASGDVANYLENDATKIPTLDGGYTYDQKLLTGGGSYVSVDTAIPYLDQLNLSTEERGELLYNTGQRGQKEERAYEMDGYNGVNGYYNIKYYGENTGGSGVARSEIIDYVKSQNPGLSNEELKPIIDAWFGVFDIKTMYGKKKGDY